MYRSLANKQKLFLEFEMFLVFYNKVILKRRILNIFNSRFSKLIFHVVLNYELPDVFLQNFYIDLKYLLK